MTLIKTGRSRLLAAGATAALAVGLIGAGGIALAQDEGEETTPPPQHQHGDGSCDGTHAGGRGMMARGLTTAETIGIEVDALRQSLIDGKTLAEVAAENGVDAQAVIDALVADANARIDEAVANGRITAEEAEEHKANAVEKITTFVNEGPQHDGPFGGGFGGPGGRHGRMR